MKKFLIPLFCSLIVTVCQGATITWSAAATVGLADSNAAPLAAGNLVRLGYFTISDSAVQAAINNVSVLEAAWHSISDTTIGTGTQDTPGTFTLAPSVPLSGAELGHQIYIWALNAPSVSSATAQAIFYEPMGSNALWKLPSDGTTGATNIDIDQAKASLGGVYLAGSFQSSAPAFDSLLGPGSGAVQLQSITAVPEPSRMLLILAGSGLVMFRRRRC